jgi:ribosome-binding protein aMBF1 (putative translation factor)
MARAVARWGYCQSPYKCEGKHKDVKLIKVGQTEMYFCHPCYDKYRRENQPKPKPDEAQTRLQKLLKEERRLNKQHQRVRDALYAVLDIDSPVREAFVKRLLQESGNG